MVLSRRMEFRRSITSSCFSSSMSTAIGYKLSAASPDPAPAPAPATSKCNEATVRE